MLETIVTSSVFVLPAVLTVTVRYAFWPFCPSVTSSERSSELPLPCPPAMPPAMALIVQALTAPSL